MASASAGVGQPYSTFPGKTGARTLKTAYRLRNTSNRAACDGVLAAGAATSPPIGAFRLDLGQRVDGFFKLNGYLQRVDIFGDLTDEQLQGLTV